MDLAWKRSGIYEEGPYAQDVVSHSGFLVYLSHFNTSDIFAVGVSVESIFLTWLDP